MNLRPSGYEPDELPNCSTPRYGVWLLRFVQLNYYSTAHRKIARGIFRKSLKNFLRWESPGGKAALYFSMGSFIIEMIVRNHLAIATWRQPVLRALKERMHAYDGRVYHPPCERLLRNWVCGPCTCPKTRRRFSIRSRDVIRPGIGALRVLRLLRPPSHYRAGPFGNGHAGQFGRGEEDDGDRPFLRSAACHGDRGPGYRPPVRLCGLRRTSMTFLCSPPRIPPPTWWPTWSPC